MDLRLTGAQTLLVSAARDFLSRRCPIEAPPGGPLAPVDLWPEMAALGWPGLLVPGDLGGSDGTLLDVMLLVEEMGRFGLGGPYVPSAVVATSLLLAAGGAPRRHVLSEMALGDRTAALAVLEETGELAPEAIAVRGEPGGVLQGRKLFVRDADVARDLIVAARGGEGVCLFHLDRARPGIAWAPMATLDGDRVFEVTFDRVPVQAGDLVGPAGAGWEVLRPALAHGALARCAEMIGAAGRILELAVEHAKARVQSGRPIGSFQAIQHACADLLRGVETARPLALAAAWKTHEGLPADVDVAMAKSYVGDACLAVARGAHQIFGAIGYCEEHPLHRFHKRILAARADYGDGAHHAETIARWIVGGGLRPSGGAGERSSEARRG
jgi:alkylation response protein AidB-like acyl-CoA dehydrogenase